MLDQKLFRQKDTLIDLSKQLERRGFSLDVEKIESLENSRKQIQKETESLQAERNSASQNIGKIKSQGGDIKPLLDEVAGLGEKLKESNDKLVIIQEQLNSLYSTIPNIPHASVVEGKSEEDNVEIKKWGNIPSFSFTPKEHPDLENIGLDFDSAAKLSGARFSVLKGGLARMHRAIAQFMLDTHTEEHGYEEVYVPYMVNANAMYGTGQLPKFEEELFKVSGDHDFYLIPTSQVPVTNLAQDTIFTEKELPKKLTAQTPCFRSEAGSHGRDVRGLIRQHQFEKVELIHMTKPEDSYQALEDLLADAESILQKLELPYRVVALCTGDMGFSAAKTYDIEVWLPGQAKYREISSCSNTESFQARRMKARYKNKQTGKTELIHTLNGSALAVGRTLVAIIENYQQEDGSVLVPKVLKPYMAGLDKILLV